MKPLVRQLHSRKGQDRTLPASLWMRYKAVEQRTLSFADLGFRFAGKVSLADLGFRFAGKSPRRSGRRDAAQPA